MHLNSELVFKKYAAPYFRDNMKVLEVGASGSSKYQRLIGNNTISWHTLDIDERAVAQHLPGNHILSREEYNYPIASDTYDLVFSGQVMEHVKKIWVWTRELYRIVKKGGLVITINPTSWPYHEAPVDCWRAYPEGTKALFEDAGFSVKFATYECLEMEHFNYSPKLLGIPNFTVGSSSLATDEYKLPVTNKIRIGYNNVLRRMPVVRRMMIPVKVAYDTITIAEK